jgi:tetratricopeptide (TPR) repeat protein
VAVGPGRRPRTQLEAIILSRRQTFEEFSEDAERFAREHGEAGTLSARHVQRLASGTRADRRPLGPVRPATRRLLERMLGYSIDDLLGPPRTEPSREAAQAEELAANLAAARAADRETVVAFRQRLDLARLLDRRLGARHLLVELAEQIKQMQKLLGYSVKVEVRQSLAAVVVDACALAGWQSLDRADPARAWDYYTQGLAAAAESESPALRSYAMAAQSVVLLDLGETQAALAMTEHAWQVANGRVPPIVAAWLSGAYGESCAANKLRDASLRAFDDAEELLSEATAEEAPFLVFDSVHLTRWRGCALARAGDARAVDVLSAALDSLPTGFVRAETAINADLAEVYTSAGEREEAEIRADRAERLACQIGSNRHRRRVDRLRRRGVVSRLRVGSSLSHR